MVHMADRPHIAMRLRPLKLRLRHFSSARFTLAVAETAVGDLAAKTFVFRSPARRP